MAQLIARSGPRRRTMNEINMVPFIDVMLVLLIIFMVTAPLITPSMIDLPRIGKAARQPDQVLQIVIDKEGLLNLKTPEGSSQIALREIVQDAAGEWIERSSALQLQERAR